MKNNLSINCFYIIKYKRLTKVGIIIMATLSTVFLILANLMGV